MERRWPESYGISPPKPLFYEVNHYFNKYLALTSRELSLERDIASDSDHLPSIKNNLIFN